MVSTNTYPTRVLDADPDLGAGIAEGERGAAGDAAVAATVHFDAGAWTPPKRAEPGHVGYLMLDGLLTHHSSIGGRTCVELLSSGDLLRPWVTLGDDAPAPVSVDWAIMQPMEVAVLDAGFARAVSRWPE